MEVEDGGRFAVSAGVGAWEDLRIRITLRASLDGAKGGVDGEKTGDESMLSDELQV